MTPTSARNAEPKPRKEKKQKPNIHQTSLKPPFTKLELNLNEPSLLPRRKRMPPSRKPATIFSASTLPPSRRHLQTQSHAQNAAQKTWLARFSAAATGHELHLSKSRMAAPKNERQQNSNRLRNQGRSN